MEFRLCSELMPGDLMMRRDGQIAEYIGRSALMEGNDRFIFCTLDGPFPVFYDGYYIGDGVTECPQDILNFVRGVPA